MTTRRQLLQGAASAALLASIAVPAFASLTLPNHEHIVWDQNQTPVVSPVFAQDLHADFVRVVHDLMKKHRADTVIMVPTALVVLQSGSISGTAPEVFDGPSAGSMKRTHAPDNLVDAYSSLEKARNELRSLRSKLVTAKIEATNRPRHIGMFSGCPVFIDADSPGTSTKLYRDGALVAEVTIREDTLSFI